MSSEARACAAGWRRPVTGFLSMLMELSNEVECQEGWVDKPDSQWMQVVFGEDAHRSWHWSSAKSLRRLCL